MVKLTQGDRNDYYGFHKRANIIYDIIRNYSKNKRFVRVLDAGCENGTISLKIAEIPNTKVIGIDIIEDYIIDANRKKEISGLINLDFLVKDAMEIKEGTFDVIVCAEVLEHLPNPRDFLNNMSRIITNEGIIIVTIPNGFGLLENITNNIIFKYIFNDGENPHIHRFSDKVFMKIIESVNLKVMKKASIEFISPPIIKYINFIGKIDCMIADKVPLSLAGGWLFLINK